jgi:FtsP/CotA-like multicopper oxidase with cupredoxin domain
MHARYVLAVASLAVVVIAPRVSVRAQVQPSCRPEATLLVNPPEIEATDGILAGSIYLTDERQHLPPAASGTTDCVEEVVRVFRREPPKEPRDREPPVAPTPGPTLRARVGDLVQLTFINQVNPTRFEQGLDIERCTQFVAPNGTPYPQGFGDMYPNCLHASSTANIHFHGTHTNPDTTGDNVYLQVRPLPRDTQAQLTTSASAASVGFDRFFRDCEQRLRANRLARWPQTWPDLPSAYTDKQREMLLAYQLQKDAENKDDQNRPRQPLLDLNNAAIAAGDWPVYYIGAFPYCFALPEGPAPGATSPVMGQLPGTHWYHAHKHGSTAVNVLNGMTGAFIIEGKYDDDLNESYRGYTLSAGSTPRPWRARDQKVLVLNQLGTRVNMLGGSAPMGGGVDFTVNGQRTPTVRMQPGEVQLWRIINTSGRTAVYFLPPDSGLEWRQLAQDGVQYDDATYQGSLNGGNLNRPFYMAPANRVDILVKAPLSPTSGKVPIRVRQGMSRASVTSVGAERPLMIVDISGLPVTLDGKPAQMPFVATAPTPPAFLGEITDEEFRRHGSIQRTLEFNSEGKHTINDLQFGHHNANISIVLGAVEEWKVVNKTTLDIDHPLHIHINPFQVTEYFDPNETFVGQDGIRRDRYVFDPDATLQPGQCGRNVKDPSTWRPCGPSKQGFWWDVFAIPKARTVDGIPIPGYYKMRSRFVDYHGTYVMHCHILIHEDRGMMYSVEIVKPGPSPAHH